MMKSLLIFLFVASVSASLIPKEDVIRDIMSDFDEDVAKVGSLKRYLGEVEHGGLDKLEKDIKGYVYKLIEDHFRQTFTKAEYYVNESLYYCHKFAQTAKNYKHLMTEFGQDSERLIRHALHDVQRHVGGLGAEKLVKRLERYFRNVHDVNRVITSLEQKLTSKKVVDDIRRYLNSVDKNDNEYIYIMREVVNSLSDEEVQQFLRDVLTSRHKRNFLGDLYDKIRKLVQQAVATANKLFTKFNVKFGTKYGAFKTWLSEHWRRTKVKITSKAIVIRDAAKIFISHASKLSKPILKQGIKFLMANKEFLTNLMIAKLKEIAIKKLGSMG